MTKQGINTPVSITSIGFGKDMTTYPRRMEWGGQIYSFIDNGIRATVRRGDRVSHTVTMTDGKSNFCLREQAGRWTLLSICQ